MSINYQFGDVDAHGALIRAQAASLEAEHQAIVRDVLAAGDFWGGAGSVACQEFITQLGRNFQVIYEQANQPRPEGAEAPAATWPARTAPSGPAGPDTPPIRRKSRAFDARCRACLHIAVAAKASPVRIRRPPYVGPNPSRFSFSYRQACITDP